MSSKYLLYVHTGRKSALQALFTVLDELKAQGKTAVVVDYQAEEIRENGASIVPAGLRELLSSDHVEILSADEAAKQVDLGLVLGGDGTILRAIEVVRDQAVPLHGVNLGHVGFLAESDPEDLRCTVNRLINGDYLIEERSALEVAVYNPNGQLIGTNWAVNEAALEKQDRRLMINVAIEIDSRPVSSFGCDGVLLSTPTGSTAYAFSAGGPVIWPEVDAMTVVPLAAHALFARPLVLGKSSRVAVELTADNRQGALLTLDGRRSLLVDPRARIEASIAKQPVKLARLAPTPFADRLVSKFQLPVEGWRGRGGNDNKC